SLRRRACARQSRDRSRRRAGAAPAARALRPAPEGGGRMGVSTLVAAATLAVSPQQFLLAHQLPGGAFAEAGGQPDVALTAWAVLGLRAARAPVDDAYLREHEDELRTPTDLALGVLAEGRPSDALLGRLERARAPAVNATAWKLLALAQAGRPLPRDRVRF